jgi:hypothetical protein
MGLIICKIHGSSGIALVCQHVEALVLTREEVRNATVLRVDVGDAGDAQTYVFCADCTAKYQLPITTDILPDATLNEYDQAFKLTPPVCGSCLLKALN